jgi:hypothetical protein
MSVTKYRVATPSGHAEFSTRVQAETFAPGADVAEVTEILHDMSYVFKRREAYQETFGSNWEETLDYIYKNGLDAYAAAKAAIKQRFPKPEGLE